MALNRITGLGMVVLGSSMLLALACDSGGTTAAPGNNNNNVGGTTSQDTSATATGGAISGSTGGAKATGGAISGSTGGAKATGGAASTSQPAGCQGLTPPTATGTLSVTSGYVTSGSTIKGYGFTWVGDKSNADTCVTPKCGTSGCTPAFGATALCAAGVVAADAEYNSIIGVGMNLSQASTGSNDPQPVSAPATITVDADLSGAQIGNQEARVQLVDSAGTSYCVAAGAWSSGSPIDITSFNTACWDDSGTPLAAGASIVSVHIIIPSDATAERPFSFCLTGVTL
jgi:hypothetical protein